MILRTAAESYLHYRMVFACLLGIVFLLQVASNVAHLILMHKASTPEEEYDVHAFVPLFGGVIGALALLIVPLPEFSKWWWVPFFIDPGSAYWVAVVLNTHIFHLGGMRPNGEIDQDVDRSCQNNKRED